MIEFVTTDGILVQGDVTDPALVASVRDMVGQVPLIVADPPYGNVVSAKWDQVNTSAEQFATWTLDWVNAWTSALAPGGAFYVWGGIGQPGFRPFFQFLDRVERETDLTLSTLITWKKKRAYGIQWGYLFTREECAYLVKGDPKKPRCFHVPLLDQKRGYAGYDPDHPAHSEFLRRSNVWDESEIFRGKVHPCQKADRVAEIPIEVHTNPGELVLDLFSGSAATSLAARKLGRLWVAIDTDVAVARDRLGV